MSRTVTLPDSLYERLEATARDRGLGSVEQLLEQWLLRAVEHLPLSEEQLRQRRELADEIDAIQAEALAACGTMTDSVELIRQDRER